MLACETLIEPEHLQRLAARIAAKFWRPGCPIDLPDLIAEGVLAGWKSLERFDPGRGFKVTTFLSHRLRGAMLDALQRAGMVRTPRKHARIIVVGDHGERPLAELVEDRHEEPPAEVDGSALTAEQRRVTQLLHGKSMTHEEVAKRLRMSVEQVREIEHRAAVELRRSISTEVQPTTIEDEEEEPMIAPAEKHETPATEATPELCIGCGNPLKGNGRCYRRQCAHYNKSGRRPPGEPGAKAKGKKKPAECKAFGITVEAAPKDATRPAVAAPTIGPAELAAMGLIVQALVGLTEPSRAVVVHWATQAFKVGA